MNRVIKFEYIFSDGVGFIKKIYTINEIEMGDGNVYESLMDEPLLKKYKLIDRRQFTGLKDKNGKMIYEGDIVTDEGSGSKGIIEWNNDDASFVVHYNGSSEDYQSFLEMDEWAIIIGNIHENPDLLK